MADNQYSIPKTFAIFLGSEISQSSNIVHFHGITVRIQKDTQNKRELSIFCLSWMSVLICSEWS